MSASRLAVREQDLRVIRPLVYVREKALRAFAESRRLPVIAENCPACFAAPQQRQRLKRLLAEQELGFPGLFGSLLAAMRPVIAIGKCRVSVKTLAACALKLVEEQPQLYERLVGGRKEGADEIEDSL